MIILVALALFAGRSHAARPHCEHTYVKQCKVAVHDPASRSPAAAGDAHARCTELLDACQTACPSRVHMCLAGMSAPMNVADRAAHGTREPSSSEDSPPPSARGEVPPGIVNVEF